MNSCYWVVYIFREELGIRIGRFCLQEELEYQILSLGECSGEIGFAQNAF